MDTFSEYLASLNDENKAYKMGNLFSLIEEKFPTLERKIGWNQPMYTEHGTYIIGFSSAARHMSVNPEFKAMEKFKKDIINNGYTYTDGIFRIMWNEDIDFNLLEKIIEFNMQDKADCTTFWRK